MLLIRVFDRGKKELLLLLLASTVALKRGVNPTTTFIRQKEGWISDRNIDTVVLNQTLEPSKQIKQKNEQY